MYLVVVVTAGFTLFGQWCPHGKGESEDDVMVLGWSLK